MAVKANLRQAVLVRRAALSAADVANHSAKLGEQLFHHFPVAAWRWLHLFLPIGSQNEPDTWPIIRRLRAEFPALRLAVPVMQPDGISLKHYELRPDTLLHPNRWGILEPSEAGAAAAAPAAFDAVLVPLLACDETGQRVGYGGGFYDRFLAQCRPGTAFIGLNVLDEAPVGFIANVLPTDIPLTACITPSRVWRFGA